MFVHILIDVREHITVGERRKRDMKKSKNVRSCSSACCSCVFFELSNETQFPYFNKSNEYVKLSIEIIFIIFKK